MSDDLIANLVKFGLTTMQSRVYVALLQLGTCRASVVSSAVRIVRPEVYRILRELSAKGLVEINAVTPSTYSATPPHLALGRLVERFNERVSALEAQRSTVLQSLESLGDSPARNAVEHRFSIIDDPSLSLRQREMISGAKDYYAGLFSKYFCGLTASTESRVVNTLLTAKRRGVKVRLIVEVDDANVNQARYLASRFEIRRSKDILFYMAIVDGRQMILGPDRAASEFSLANIRDVNLWTNSATFVNGMYALFEKLWKTSSKFRHGS